MPQQGPYCFSPHPLYEHRCLHWTWLANPHVQVSVLGAKREGILHRVVVPSYLFSCRLFVRCISTFPTTCITPIYYPPTILHTNPEMRIPSSVSVITTLLITVGSAQSINDYLTQIPSCALTCIAAGATASGCGSTDYNCICGTARPIVIKNITPCIASGCSVPDALSMFPFPNYTLYR